MEKYAKILCDTTNRFVVQVPGEHPGAVIQGDDLISLKEDARDVYEMVKDSGNQSLVFMARMVADKLDMFFDNYDRFMDPNEDSTVNSDFSILIADDDKMICKILCEAIDKHYPNIDIEVVHDGESALDVIREETPSALILNMNMPRMNGAQVLRELEKEQIEMPILVISGYYRNKGDISEASGVSPEKYEHLSKPFKMQKMFDFIDSNISK